MKSHGAEIIDPVEIPPDAKISEPEMDVLLFELKAGLNAYFKARGRPKYMGNDALESLIAFNRKNASRELKYFGQELFEQSQKKGPLTDPAYLKARAECIRLTRTEGIDAATAKNKLTVLVAPTSCLAWLTDYINGDSANGGCSTAPAVAGYPHITVPAGLVGGLPAGISFFGPAWSEPALIKVAYAFEQATKARRNQPTRRASRNPPRPRAVNTVKRWSGMNRTLSLLLVSLLSSLASAQTVISTIAGSSTGASGFSGDGGQATAAKLNQPSGIAVDSSGNIYIADTNNFRVRMISPSGVITTVAGNGTQGFSGDGGPATAAS